MPPGCQQGESGLRELGDFTKSVAGEISSRLRVADVRQKVAGHGEAICVLCAVRQTDQDY